jgi:glycosyltransferase involved in cell wall biosynthesis
MIYRTDVIPRPRTTIRRWRKLFRERFNEDPIMVMTQSFGEQDPGAHGFDGAIEFPPHKLLENIRSITETLSILDPDFTGSVVRYDEVVRVSLDEPRPDYPLIKTIVPGWDNDARRQGKGLVVTGGTPGEYEAWLAALIQTATEHPFFGEKLVCVNAWNEWCEGAYLEPDQHFGAAYLNATARAVSGRRRGVDDPRGLLLIGHDAFPSGAQFLLLDIARSMRSNFNVTIEFLLLGGGELEATYTALAPTTVVSEEGMWALKLKEYADRGFRDVLVNTLVAAKIVPLLRHFNLEATVLVHELPSLIREQGLAGRGRSGLLAARHVVYASPFVRDAVGKELEIEAGERSVIAPQGILRSTRYDAAAARRVRRANGVRNREALVVGIGYADMRKGFDLFLQLWRRLNHGPARKVHFCWLGKMHPSIETWLAAEIDAAKLTGTFHMPGFSPHVTDFLWAADCFVLSSREDPMPSSAIEALMAGCPVVAFDNTGGIPDLLRESGTGVSVPLGDIDAMAAAVEREIATKVTIEARKKRAAAAGVRFAFDPYIRTLRKLAMPRLPSVSVVVPNYNYAAYLAARLTSIFSQNHPVEEIIVLDDNSTDDSVEVVSHLGEEWGRRITLIKNRENSGSVFAQWRRGAELARGEYVWIAEADDSADPAFLRRILDGMAADPEVVLGFSDSRSVDADGVCLSEDSKAWYAKCGAGSLMASDVFDGADFVRQYLSSRNVILNVSGAVWRTDALLAALRARGETVEKLQLAGDWLLYVQALVQPGARIFYEASPLNVHRRHRASVTRRVDPKLHLNEIRYVQRMVCEMTSVTTGTRQAQRTALIEAACHLNGKATPDIVKLISPRGTRSRSGQAR